jgi:hypothetical protein
MATKKNRPCGLNVKVTIELRQWAKQRAERRGQKLNAMVTEALESMRHSDGIWDEKRKWTLAQISEELSNSVYAAALWYERAEGMGFILGNGHHLAQKLAAEAVRMLNERKS